MRRLVRDCLRNDAIGVPRPICEVGTLVFNYSGGVRAELSLLSALVFLPYVNLAMEERATMTNSRVSQAIPKGFFDELRLEEPTEYIRQMYI